jgi:VWFA-related protein
MTHLVKWIGAFVLAAGILTAQSSGHRVQLNVVAVDSHGQPVTDLKSEDFRIQDEGKAQTIAAFTAPSANPVRPSTLILMDFLNMDISNRGALVEQMDRALEGLETGESVYLFLLTNEGKLYVIHAPSEKPSAADASWNKNIRTLLQQGVDATFGIKNIPQRDQGFQSGATFNALESIAERFTAIPGRKNIVWFTRGVVNHICCPYSCSDVIFHPKSGDYVAGQHESSGFCPQTGLDYKPFLRHFATQMNAGNTALYAVEQVSGAPVGSDAGGPRDTLAQLSGLTGGRMYAGANVDKVLAQSMQDALATYRMSFDPASPADGKYRKLKVTCSRKGVQVQAMQGYYAEK